VWDKLRKQVAVEVEQLNYLIEVHRPLLTKCTGTTPNDIELSALAAMLHSFYTGIENIFKRVAVELDSAPPRGESWHRELLDAMIRPNAARPAVLSTPLRDRLREYLEFRHVFRQAYSFQLRWDKMSPLVLGCEETLRQLEAELDVFLRSRLV
jgi:hypothetical protein